MHKGTDIMDCEVIVYGCPVTLEGKACGRPTKSQGPAHWTEEHTLSLPTDSTWVWDAIPQMTGIRVWAYEADTGKLLLTHTEHVYVAPDTHQGMDLVAFY